MDVLHPRIQINNLRNMQSYAFINIKLIAIVCFSMQLNKTIIM